MIDINELQTQVDLLDLQIKALEGTRFKIQCIIALERNKTYEKYIPIIEKYLNQDLDKDLQSGEKEKLQDKLITKYSKELGFKLADFYAGDGKKINKLLESREEREGTFDYFMTKSKEDLIEYQKNFNHSFDNPAEHDPKFVAWKKACEVKKCFPKENPEKNFRGIQKEPGFPSKVR